MKSERNPSAIIPCVTASVIAWNDEAHLARCLASLARQTHPAIRVIVVDNASRDGSAEAALEACPDATLIRSTENLGYAGAHNLAFAASTDPYFFVLNADVRLAPDYVAKLVAAMEGEPGLGSVSGKLLRGESTLDADAAGGEILDSAGITRDWRGRFRDLGADRPGGEYPVAAKVFGVCGAAALYRRAAVLDAVPEVESGGRPFDAAFFAYYEDADLAWALQRRAWSARVAPDAVAAHVRGGSGTPARRVEQLLHRNAFWLLLKHAAPGEWFRGAPGWLFYEFAKLLQSISYRPGLWRAQWARLTGTPAMLRRRRALSRNEVRPRLAPRPDYQRLERDVRDRQAGSYDSFVDSPYHAAIELGAVFERLCARRGERVIDLGCGTGRVSVPLAESGVRVVGVDFSHASLRQAATKRPDAVFVQADLTKLPFKEGVFDRAVSCQVLEHLPDAAAWRGAFVEAARVLRKEGEIVLTAYHDAWTHRPFSPREGQHPGGIFYHRFRGGELTRLLETAFEAQASFGIRHVPARSIGRRLMAKPLFRWLPWIDRALEGTPLSAVFAHLWIVHGRKKDAAEEIACE